MFIFEVGPTWSYLDPTILCRGWSRVISGLLGVNRETGHDRSPGDWKDMREIALFFRLGDGVVSGLGWALQAGGTSRVRSMEATAK
jgi:hypothetical protein